MQLEIVCQNTISKSSKVCRIQFQKVQKCAEYNFKTWLLLQKTISTVKKCAEYNFKTWLLLQKTISTVKKCAEYNFQNVTSALLQPSKSCADYLIPVWLSVLLLTFLHCFIFYTRQNVDHKRHLRKTHWTKNGGTEQNQHNKSPTWLKGRAFTQNTFNQQKHLGHPQRSRTPGRGHPIGHVVFYSTCSKIIWMGVLLIHIT